MQNDVVISPEVLARMEEAVRNAYSSNVRDPVAMKEACDRMDRMAEKNARLYGVHNDGVDIIREMRESR